MGYYLTIRKNKLLINEIAWINLKNIICVSESSCKRTFMYDFILNEFQEQANLFRINRNQKVIISRAKQTNWKERKREILGVMKMFSISIWVVVI